MTRRSRVALIHYAAPPVVGGVEQVMRRHADLMAAHGFSVQVVAGRGEAWDTHVPVDLIPLLDSRHPDVLAAKARLDTGVIPEGFEDLVSRIEQGLTNALGDVDIVIAHNVCSLHKNLALTVALHRKFETGTWRKLILWHHDLAWLSPRYAGELHDGWPWDLLRQPWGATQVVVSRFRQEQLADLLGMEAQEIHVVPNGVSETESLRLGAENSGIGAEAWSRSSPSEAVAAGQSDSSQEHRAGGCGDGDRAAADAAGGDACDGAGGTAQPCQPAILE